MQSLPRRDFEFFTYPDAPSDPPLRVKTSSSWTYCGPLLRISSSDPDCDSGSVSGSGPTPNLPETYHHWSDHALSSSLLPRLVPFLAAAHAFLRGQNLSHYWITIRASRPGPEFDAPRWHTDDYFFGADSRAVGTAWKLCATLLGPGTLFAADGARARGVLSRAKKDARRRQRDHVCVSIRCAACGKTSDEVRDEMARLMRDRDVVQSGPGEAVFFRVGDRRGAVHSEPRIDRDRVFVNVVPGTEAELRGLATRWGLEFPRSWSLGVPSVSSGLGGAYDVGSTGGETEGTTKKEHTTRHGDDTGI